MTIVKPCKKYYFSTVSIQYNCPQNLFFISISIIIINRLC